MERTVTANFWTQRTPKTTPNFQLGSRQLPVVIRFQQLALLFDHPWGRISNTLPVVRTTAQQTEKCNIAIANFVFTASIAFKSVEVPSFVKMCRVLRPGYNPPKRRKIANENLDPAYSKPRDRAIDMINSTSKPRTSPHHYTLVSDGWTNIQSESIVNYCLVSPDGQALSHKSDPTDANSHTGEYLAAELAKLIAEVAPKDINAICTGTTSNMLSAVKTLCKTYQHIHPIAATHISSISWSSTSSRFLTSRPR